MLERLRGTQALVMRPLARFLLRLGIGPDAVTWFGTLSVTVVALVCFPLGWLWQGAVAIAVLSSSDMIDGHMARESGAPTRWGSFLDSSLDRLADAAVIGGISLFLGISGRWWVWPTLAVVALVLAEITSYVKARAEAVGCTADAGPLTRADRIALCLVGTLAAGLGVGWALPVLVVLLCLGGAITVVRRMREVSDQLRTSERGSQQRVRV